MVVVKAFEQTPLGSRIVFGLSVCCYILYVFDHHDFVRLDLVCRPQDVIYGLQLQRLVLASFVHKTWVTLSLAVLISWRRFAWLEHEHGTLGFVLWFLSSSVLLHGIYCIVALSSGFFTGGIIVVGEAHGLFPLLIASLVASIRETDNAEVWLWPLPFHVSVRAFPFVVIVLSWLFHWEAHFDVAVAYVVAATAPELVQPGADWGLLERFEQTSVGRQLTTCFQFFDAFVCRPPSSSLSTAGSWLGRPFSESTVFKRCPGTHGGEILVDNEVSIVGPSTVPLRASGQDCMASSGGGGGGCGKAAEMIALEPRSVSESDRCGGFAATPHANSDTQVIGGDEVGLTLSERL
eukprot:TRINITY_DN67663_c0_g1_i1.p1 TRINITY_DN67663_c0_g1~~TRINITY_DN67663_c0_g1_i1.p1  ORF type:complete len:349 (+),score=36.14 TRINITY_DN67663_c0_g1_i1:137-1183(+)